MVRLTTAANAMEARVLAARLGAEGIVWQFQGSVDGPLAVGPVEVLVDADEYDTARQLLLVDEVESSFTDEPRPAHVTTSRDVLWLAVILAAAIGLAILRVAT
jgi:hypothetical protein